MRRSHHPWRPVKVSASTPLLSSRPTSAPPSACSGYAEELLKLLNRSICYFLIMVMLSAPCFRTFDSYINVVCPKIANHDTAMMV
jgi:hypothetical protein